MKFSYLFVALFIVTSTFLVPDAAARQGCKNWGSRTQKVCHSGQTCTLDVTICAPAYDIKAKLVCKDGAIPQVTKIMNGSLKVGVDDNRGSTHQFSLDNPNPADKQRFVREFYCKPRAAASGPSS